MTSVLRIMESKQELNLTAGEMGSDRATREERRAIMTQTGECKIRYGIVDGNGTTRGGAISRRKEQYSFYA